MSHTFAPNPADCLAAWRRELNKLLLEISAIKGRLDRHSNSPALYSKYASIREQHRKKAMCMPSLFAMVLIAQGANAVLSNPSSSGLERLRAIQGVRSRLLAYIKEARERGVHSLVLSMMGVWYNSYDFYTVVSFKRFCHSLPFETPVVGEAGPRPHHAFHSHGAESSMEAGSDLYAALPPATALQV
jgi:hypothetical protein